MEGRLVVTLAQLVYQISTDPEFASKFRTEPRSASAAAGSTLTDAELSALVQALDAQADQSGSLLELFADPIWFAAPLRS